MATVDPRERIGALRELFREAINNTETARNEAMVDLGYYHEQQWSAAEQAEFKKRRQPLVTFNVIRDKIESICGFEEQSDTAPKAWPRTPEDEQAAQVATDTLRYVCDLNRFDKTRIDILRDTMICGTGGVIVEVTQGRAGYEIKLRKLRWETIIYDPYSREADFSDARYLGSALWMDEADVIAVYGDDATEPVQGALNDQSLAGNNSSLEDRPNAATTWSDPDRRRVLVVELYHKESDGWMLSVFTGAGIILDQESPYLDDDGLPTCPIEMVSAYVDGDNQRYGAVRGMRSPQDEINHRRSKALHGINTRQTFRRSGAIASSDPQKLRRELNKPDGDVVISRNAVWGTDVGIIDTSSEIQGNLEMMMDAKTFIDKQGANNAMMGRGTEGQSGRAILAQQQAGLQTLATVFSSHNDWILRIYRQIWARAKQFWTDKMWIRVTDDLGAPQFISVNEPVIDEMGQPVIGPQTGQPAMQRRLAEMDVDLIVDRVPASANIQQEEFGQIVELIKSGAIPNSPKVMAALVSTSALRPKAKKPLIDAIMEPTQQDPQQIQMMVRQALAEIAKTETQAAKNAADAQQTQAETQLMGVQAVQQQAALMPPMQQPQQMPPIPPDLPPIAQPMPPDQAMPIPEQPQPPQGGFFNGEIPQ